MANILIVEDSKEYQILLTRTMGDHETVCVSSVDEAMAALRNRTYDLILLDISLPVKDGYVLLTELQSEDPSVQQIPVICLTSRTEVTDKVTAFSLGAEDYILKPFDPIELRARVSAKLHRFLKRRELEQTTAIDGLIIDHTRHRVLVNDATGSREVDLTQTEFKLLCCLVKRPEQVFSRDQLLVAAWGADAKVLERVVDVHLCSLRKKLSSHSAQIKSVPGVGYKFVPTQALKKSA